MNTIRISSVCRINIVLACVLGDALAVSGAHAQSPAQSSASASQPAGDEGQRIATQGVPDKGVQPCIACHGVNGEGNAAAGFPRLAGQNAAYLLRQLQAYASGARVNPVMQPIAKGMTAAQQQAVSSYLSQLKVPGVAGGAKAQPKANTSSRAATLAERGDERLKVQACANCHGPQGIGEGAVGPALAGQHAAYLVTALKEWKDGSRKTDPSGQMPSIAQALNEADMNALAQYYAALPPSDAPATRAAASTGRHLNPVPSGPRQSGKAGGPAGNNAQSPQGIGTEQGAPTTGGNQGPGGGGGGTGSGSSGGKGGTP